MFPTTLPSRNKKRREKGLTLIEASMVLTLSAVVVAGAVMYYQGAEDSNNLQRGQALLGGVQSAVKSMYASQPTYAGISEKAISRSSVIPPTYKDATDGLRTPWGGAIKIAPADHGSRGDGAYTVEFADLPQSACVALGSMGLGNSLIGLEINATDISPIAGIVTPDAAISADSCKAGSQNKITWMLK